MKVAFFLFGMFGVIKLRSPDASYYSLCAFFDYDPSDDCCFSSDYCYSSSAHSSYCPIRSLPFFKAPYACSVFYSLPSYSLPSYSLLNSPFSNSDSHNSDFHNALVSKQVIDYELKEGYYLILDYFCSCSSEVWELSNCLRIIPIFAKQIKFFARKISEMKEKRVDCIDSEDRKQIVSTEDRVGSLSSVFSQSVKGLKSDHLVDVFHKKLIDAIAPEVYKISEIMLPSIPRVRNWVDSTSCIYKENEILAEI